MRTIISDVDEASLTGELGEVVAACFRAAFHGGPWGWRDDDLAHVPSARSGLRSEHGHLSLVVGSIGEILDGLIEAGGLRPRR